MVSYLDDSAAVGRVSELPTTRGRCKESQSHDKVQSFLFRTSRFHVRIIQQVHGIASMMLQVATPINYEKEMNSIRTEASNNLFRGKEPAIEQIVKMTE